MKAQTKTLSIFSTFAVLTSLVSTFAQAHFELGVYRGHDAAGASCQIEFKSVEFKDGFKHPLNERVTVAWNQGNHVLSHLPQVDTAAGEVGFEHEQLTEVQGVPGGAKALVVKMAHGANREGPSEVTELFHDYKNPTNNQKAVCTDLVHTQ